MSKTKNIPTMEELHREFLKRCGGEDDPGTIEEDFTDNCYAVACVLSDLLTERGVKARPVYGQWYGRSVIRSGIHFHRHGWVESGGSILDPTRFAFEGKPAYMFVGLKKEYKKQYDEGGRTLNSARPWPSRNDPDLNPRLRNDNRTYVFDWSPQTEALIKGLSGAKQVKTLDTPQVMWIANYDFEAWGDCIHEIYKKLEEQKLNAFIPWDFQKYEEAKREGLT